MMRNVLFFGQKIWSPKNGGFLCETMVINPLGSQSVKESLKQKQSHITNPKQLSGNLHKLMAITTVWVLRNLIRYMNFLPPLTTPKKTQPRVKGVAKPLGMKRPGGGVNPIEVDTIEPSSDDVHPTLVGWLVESLRFACFMLRRMVGFIGSKYM